MIPTHRIGTALLVLLLPMVQRVAAWEVDVHYVLTCWLAEQAGFSKEDAHMVASADQNMDDSRRHAAIPTMLSIIFFGDVGAAQDLHDRHFPSGAKLPSPPQSRVLQPGGPAARDAVDAVIRVGQNAPSLRKLGEALHPFQDSWSHQGVPDVPLGLRPTLSCAHPAARGGWASHRADVTHLHVDEVVEQAEQTYGVLTTFLKRYPRFKSHPPHSWAALRPRVVQFAQARTKKQKDHWAVASLKAPVRTASSLTVTGGRSAEPPRIIRARERATEKAPPELVAAARDFLGTWFARQDPRGAAMKFVRWTPTAQFVDQFDDDDLRAMTADAGGDLTEGIIRWCSRFMTMFLVEDHAAIDNFGHCDPKHTAYRELPLLPAAQGVFRTRRSVKPPVVTATDFVQVSNQDYVLIFHPEGLSRDAICLEWRIVLGEGWQIMRMFALTA